VFLRKFSDFSRCTAVHYEDTAHNRSLKAVNYITQITALAGKVPTCFYVGT